jgi:hypothetical protein
MFPRTASSISKAAKLASIMLVAFSNATAKLHTRVGNSLFREGLNRGSLVTGSVDELVVDDFDVGVVGGQEGDLVRNSLGFSEVGDVLANTSEVHNDVLAAGTAELRLALLTNDDNVAVGLLEEHSADTLGQARVDTTAETLVGAGNNDQGLLVITLQRLGLGLLEDGVGGLTV